jgi:hypothetical protein
MFVGLNSEELDTRPEAATRTISHVAAAVCLYLHVCGTATTCGPVSPSLGVSPSRPVTPYVTQVSKGFVLARSRESGMAQPCVFSTRMTPDQPLFSFAAQSRDNKRLSSSNSKNPGSLGGVSDGMAAAGKASDLTLIRAIRNVFTMHGRGFVTKPRRFAKHELAVWQRIGRKRDALLTSPRALELTPSRCVFCFPCWRLVRLKC